MADRRVSLHFRFYLLLVVIGVLTTAASADSSQSDMDAFVSRIIDNSATSQQVESYIAGLSARELDSFVQSLAAALGVSAADLAETTQPPANMVIGAASSGKISLGHTVDSSSLISSSRWYNHRTKCDNESDMERLFVYRINPSKSRSFRWIAPNSAVLTVVMLIAYHRPGQPGLQALLIDSELHVCIGDTVVNTFSNTDHWGNNHIGNHLKVRQY